jgi:hypothetical protein
MSAQQQQIQAVCMGMTAGPGCVHGDDSSPGCVHGDDSRPRLCTWGLQQAQAVRKGMTAGPTLAELQ